MYLRDMIQAKCCPRHHMLQFAPIARPIVDIQCLHGVIGKIEGILRLHAPENELGEVIGQEGNIPVIFRKQLYLCS